MVLGFPLVVLPIDCIYGTPQNAVCATQSDFVLTIKQKQQETQQFMREFMDDKKIHQKAFYDRSKYRSNYTIG